MTELWKIQKRKCKCGVAFQPVTEGQQICTACLIKPHRYANLLPPVSDSTHWHKGTVRFEERDCIDCGKSYFPKSSRQKLCAGCSGIHKVASAVRARDKREAFAYISNEENIEKIRKEVFDGLPARTVPS